MSTLRRALHSLRRAFRRPVRARRVSACCRARIAVTGNPFITLAWCKACGKTPLQGLAAVEASDA